MCKHKWKAVAVGNGLFQDECENCGCIGYMDFAESKIKAKPMAKVIDFQKFKARKKK